MNIYVLILIKEISWIMKMSRQITPTIKLAKDALEKREKTLKGLPNPQPESSIFANGCFWGLVEVLLIVNVH